jgi:hypothetical protein
VSIALDYRSLYVLIAPMLYPRRFPPPWKVEEQSESFAVVDGRGQPLAYFYFEDEPTRRDIAKRLTKDDAWRLARAFTRVPALMQRD